jgi:toxin ParE1/3/4
VELKLFWTVEARNDLKAIYDYHLEVAGERIAAKLTASIVLSTVVLKTSAEVGQREKHLLNRPQEFRYLVVGNYKVIYWVEKKLKTVHIASVFDCRQNPKKMKDIR